MQGEAHRLVATRGLVAAGPLHAVGPRSRAVSPVSPEQICGAEGRAPRCHRGDLAKVVVYLIDEGRVELCHTGVLALLVLKAELSREANKERGTSVVGIGRLEVERALIEQHVRVSLGVHALDRNRGPVAQNPPEERDVRGVFVEAHIGQTAAKLGKGSVGRHRHPRKDATAVLPRGYRPKRPPLTALWRGLGALGVSAAWLGDADGSVDYGDENGRAAGRVVGHVFAWRAAFRRRPRRLPRLLPVEIELDDAVVGGRTTVGGRHDQRLLEAA